jgi:hypothetical protein
MAASTTFKISICSNNPSVLTESELFTQVNSSTGSTKPGFQSFGEWGLTIDPKSSNFGFVEKADFAFVPLMVSVTSIDQLNSLFGLKIENPDQIVKVLAEKF